MNVMLAFPGAPARAFRNPVAVLVAHSVGDVRGVLEDADAAAARGHHCVGFVAYEAAPAFDAAFRVAARADASFPLAWFGVFERTEPVNEGHTDPLGQRPAWRPDVSRMEYDAAAHWIHDAIGRGDVYQVNHTFRLRSDDVHPLALWHHLRLAQPSAYAAYIDTGVHQIVSASPELFFERRDRDIVLRPMKGTATRGRWPVEDDAHAAQLAASEKERAENVMIVDLVRNDVGRIADVGSVAVSALCEVERHPTVLQMTSTVRARLRERVGTFDVFAALFPSGSVTGAPKIAAMSAIAELESSERGVYCGAIGYVCGNTAAFSVAIRTATVMGTHGVYGVGGGITWDSVPDREYAEALMKGRVLTMPLPDVQLVETLRLEDARYPRFARHIERLRRSALRFGWPDPTVKAEEALRQAVQPGRWRVRLALDREAVSITVASLPRDTPETPLKVPFAPEPVDSSDPLLYHKTSRWPPFPVQLRRNERGELTEFSSGNLVVELDGARWTPPVSAGLLPGVFRQELLERGEIHERTLSVDDLHGATGSWLINSVREWVPVSLLL